jgi:group I intron endonuclease
MREMTGENAHQPGGIYRLVNTVTGKSYVGSSVNLRSREKQHRRTLEAGNHHSSKVRRSCAKHGPDAFTFEVLERCLRESLLEREAFWMAHFDAVANGYNVRPDPSTNFGVAPSDEARAKMSAARKGRALSPRTRQKISDAATGRDMSRQVANSAAKRRGVPLPESTKLKISAALTGKPKTADHARKVAQSHLGRKRSDETRKRISEAQRGKKRPELAAAQTGRKQSAETVAKRVAKLKGRAQTPEHVAKRVEAVRLRRQLQAMGQTAPASPPVEQHNASSDGTP